jgi:hypothetical protein
MYVYPIVISPKHLNPPLALEVTTDAPHPPALNIVSPTPRAFTFPITHNLSDSPYASPSSSPFEPDLYPLSLQCTTTSSSSTTPPLHNFSPDTPLRSSSSPFNNTPELKARKSSCSSDLVERRPKKGDEDYVKRPENAFILFRRKCCEDRQQAEDVAAAAVAADGPTTTAKKQRQADLSKTISQQWKSLAAEERQFWEQMAKDKKKEHEQLYPNYVYRPQRAKDKDGKTKNKKSSKKFDEDTGSLSFVVPVHRHGRSASAPTPPPYQSIQIPNVYHMTPSCPTSPSLLPMISRRSAHPGHPEEVMSSFDYLPNNSYAAPQSFPLPAQFEANHQVKKFFCFCYFRNIFKKIVISFSHPISSGIFLALQLNDFRSCIIFPCLITTTTLRCSPPTTIIIRCSSHLRHR